MAGPGLDYRWNLRELMDAGGIHTTTELNFRLRQRGVELSPMQVCHLVTEKPDRVSVQVLLALCDVLHCSSAELIQPSAADHLPSPRTGRPVTAQRVRGVR